VIRYYHLIVQHRGDNRETTVRAVVPSTEGGSEVGASSIQISDLKMSAQDGTCSEGNAQQGYPSLCKNGCGFFSSVDSKGFCSVCYKDFLKKEQSTATETTEEVAATTASLSNLNVSVDEAEASTASSSTLESEVVDGAAAKPSVPEPAAEEPEEAKEPKKVKKNRCASCKKKVGLTGFACRCGGMYCGIHRYSDKHNCTFDYGALGKSEIAAANPVIVAEKVAKI